MKAAPASKIYYGYYIVGACFIVLFLLWGMVLNTFPIFFKPIAESMKWSRGDLALALLMGAIGTTLSAPVAGKMIDRFGARPIMAFGAAVIGVGLLAGSRIQHLWQLYIIFALIGGGLMCATIIPCSFIISNWFVSRRGTAMGFAFVGTSVGGMLMSWVANWIILNYGWRTAFVWSGATILLIVIPVVLFLIRTRPSEVGLEPYRDPSADPTGNDENWGVGVKEAFSLKIFWQIAAIMLLIGLVTGGLGNHSVAYLTDQGYSPSSAALSWSIVMGVMILGKLAFGPIADRWGAKYAMAIACFLLSISIVLLAFAQFYAVVIAFAVLYGFACGAPLVINPMLTAEGLGMKNFGAIFGVLNIMANLGGAAGPVGAGYFFDVFETYRPVFYFFTLLMVGAAFLALSITRARQPLSGIERIQPAKAAE